MSDLPTHHEGGEIQIRSVDNSDEDKLRAFRVPASYKNQVLMVLTNWNTSGDLDGATLLLGPKEAHELADWLHAKASDIEEELRSE